MNEGQKKQAALDLWVRLEGKDKRSISESEAVVADILKNTELFPALMQGILEPDPVLRMRCADAAVKISTQQPKLLQPFKEIILEQLTRIEQQEVRWHVTQMFSLLELTHHEKEQVLVLLKNFLDDKSSIVKTFAMQALADLAATDPALKAQIIPLLKELTHAGTPAMRARGRKLLTGLEKANNPGLTVETEE